MPVMLLLRGVAVVLCHLVAVPQRGQHAEPEQFEPDQPRVRAVVLVHMAIRRCRQASAGAQQQARYQARGPGGRGVPRCRLVQRREQRVEVKLPRPRQPCVGVSSAASRIAPPFVAHPGSAVVSLRGPAPAPPGLRAVGPPGPHPRPARLPPAPAPRTRASPGEQRCHIDVRRRAPPRTALPHRCPPVNSAATTKFRGPRRAGQRCHIDVRGRPAGRGPPTCLGPAGARPCRARRRRGAVPAGRLDGREGTGWGRAAAGRAAAGTPRGVPAHP